MAVDDGEVVAEGKQCRLLFVDDERLLTATVSRFLRQADPKLIVDTAGTLQETRERTDALTKKRGRFGYDALVLDLFLPDGTTADLVPWIIEAKPRPGVIFYTGYHSPAVGFGLARRLFRAVPGGERLDPARTLVLAKGSPSELLDPITCIAPEAWIDEKLAAVASHFGLTAAEHEAMRRAYRSQATGVHLSQALKTLGCRTASELVDLVEAWPIRPARPLESKTIPHPLL